MEGTIHFNFWAYVTPELQLDNVYVLTPQSREIHLSFVEGAAYQDYTGIIAEVYFASQMNLSFGAVYLLKGEARTQLTQEEIDYWCWVEIGAITGTEQADMGYIDLEIYLGMFDAEIYVEVTGMKYVADDAGGSHSVGGTIFYIDNTAASGHYTFYNEYGVRKNAPTVGQDCTGWTYDISGTPAKDRYYVYNPDTVFSGRTGTVSDPYISWTYLDESPDIIATYETEELPAYVSRYGRVCENLNITGTAVGTGKTNTSSIMSIERDVTIGGITSNTHAYVQGPQINSTRSYDSSTYTETVWYICDNFNKGSYSKKNNTTGCSDWYVPSKDEQSRLAEHFSSLDSYSSFIGTEKSYSWSSSCSDGVAWSTTSGNIDGYSWGLNAYGSGAYYPNSMGESKFYNGKHQRFSSYLMCLFLIRSF